MSWTDSRKQLIDGHRRAYDPTPFPFAGALQSLDQARTPDVIIAGVPFAADEGLSIATNGAEKVWTLLTRRMHPGLRSPPQVD